MGLSPVFLGCRTSSTPSWVYQNFNSLKHLIWEMDFTFIKCSTQGNFAVKKGTIEKLFLLKMIGIYQWQVSMFLVVF